MKFIGKSLLALMLFGVILRLTIYASVFLAIGLTYKIMSGQY